MNVNCEISWDHYSFESSENHEVKTSKNVLFKNVFKGVYKRSMFREAFLVCTLVSISEKNS